ncbi:MAG TPA: methyltransferase domain-containing protein [Tepidisphaeraceae bacterium]|nr:methyltransferase domain-containing protein [Tepidisphaeraceae bacterium]
MTQTWNPANYQQSHGFVFQLGRGLIDLLDPKPGERILDLGCGTGQLTSEIAARGAQVRGIDKSAEMVAQASRNFPSLKFEVGDAAQFTTPEPFDAVFSNAALHWMKPPRAVARRIGEALRPGGRLVAEMGGRGNITQLLAGIHAVAARMEISLAASEGANYFPSIAEYATLLEEKGLEVTFAWLFDRPTQLEDKPSALRDWVQMFRSGFVATIPPDRCEAFFAALEDHLRPILYRDGRWFADYRRLRLVARKN